MGIVYRAIDTKLDREVALKILPPELVADPDRKRRFVQEAKAAAALHHPHIATIFEIDEADDTTFIAMELIRGEKLSDVIRDTPLPVHRALELATEIAEGLSRAHDKGIIHRDLKSGNIMLDDDDHAKIIDFGLAKLTEPIGSTSDSQDDTALRQTESGKILGTVSYMSPEQARGKTLDHRSDIFSFGIVLFEMLTGRLPFQGPSGVETLNAILKEPTPSLELADGDEIERIISRCLEKDPEARYQTTKDLLSELRRLRRDSDTSVTTSITPATSTTSWPRRIAFAAIGAIGAAALFNIFTRSGDSGVPQLTNPVQVTSAQGAELNPTWAPGGDRLAYHSTLRGLGNSDVWVAQLSGGEPVNRTANHVGHDRNPAWSPDGSQIAFESDREGQGMYVMSALGGTARKVLETRANLIGRPTWSADGSRLAAVGRDEDGSKALRIVTLSTREIEDVHLESRSGNNIDMSWSPDERFMAYVDAVDFTAEITQIRLARLDDNTTVDVTDGTSQDWSPSWSSDGGRLFYVSNRQGSMDLWQQRINDDGSLDGDAERITTGLGIRSAAFSRDGSKLAYTLGRGQTANVWRVPILSDRVATWSDAEQLTFDQAFVEFLDVSPDGEQLVISSDRSGNQDLWTLPAAGGELRQLTDDAAPDWRPEWSADGSQVAFYSYRSGNRDIWVIGADGSSPTQVTRFEGPDLHPTWAPDGTKLAFASVRESDSFQIFVIDRDGGEPTLIAETPGDNLPTWSPDGEWLALRSLSTGSMRIWRVRVDGSDLEQISDGTSQGQPRWSPDGQHVFFAAGGERGPNIWTVSLETREERALTHFTGRPGTIGNFGLATDGEYLYFNWYEEVGDLWVMDVVRD